MAGSWIQGAHMLEVLPNEATGRSIAIQQRQQCDPRDQGLSAAASDDAILENGRLENGSVLMDITSRLHVHI